MWDSLAVHVLPDGQRLSDGNMRQDDVEERSQPRLRPKAELLYYCESDHATTGL
jgi:hypothetical protein